MKNKIVIAGLLSVGVGLFVTFQNMSTSRVSSQGSQQFQSTQSSITSSTNTPPSSRIQRFEPLVDEKDLQGLPNSGFYRAKAAIVALNRDWANVQNNFSKYSDDLLKASLNPAIESQFKKRREALLNQELSLNLRKLDIYNQYKILNKFGYRGTYAQIRQKLMANNNYLKNMPLIKVTKADLFRYSAEIKKANPKFYALLMSKAHAANGCKIEKRATKWRRGCDNKDYLLDENFVIKCPSNKFGNSNPVGNEMFLAGDGYNLFGAVDACRDEGNGPIDEVKYYQAVQVLDEYKECSSGGIARVSVLTVTDYSNIGIEGKKENRYMGIASACGCLNRLWTDGEATACKNEGICPPVTCAYTRYRVPQWSEIKVKEFEVIE